MLIASDKYDRKKVLYHTHTVSRLLSTGDAWPITVNTGFTTYCNHSCIWCSSAYTTRIDPKQKGRDKLLIDPKIWIDNMERLSKNGTKGLIIAGQGEPLLHPESESMLNRASELGLSYMVYTNGERLGTRFHDSLLSSCLSVRFSVDAASREMHEKYHAAKNLNGRGKANFELVLSNIENLVYEKRRRNLQTPTIGVQMICSELTEPEFEPFVRLFKGVGVDYIAFKALQANDANRDLIASSFSMIDNERERELHAEKMIKKLWDLKELYSDDQFEIFVKGDQIKSAYVSQYNGALNYKMCIAHPLTPMIEPDGNVYLCIDMGGNDDFVIGNIYEDDIETIWRSKRRQQVIEKIDLHRVCPAGCFLDDTNKILTELLEPPTNVHPALI
jgi:cyclic pyranopterin phosphate synthase